MRDLTRGHLALRRGRVSIPAGEYFLTICTQERRSSLTSPTRAESILKEAGAMDADSTWRLRCMVVMPDHVHILATLGERLSLGKAIARLKSKASAALRLSGPLLQWERDFFDHHLRAGEDRLSIFLYIYLNPYRAGLCGRSQGWPWYYCCDEDWAWFKAYLHEDRPIPEWLM